jgi:hypothetical protein
MESPDLPTAVSDAATPAPPSHFSSRTETYGHHQRRRTTRPVHHQPPLAELASRHGVTSVRLGADPAEVVMTLEADRTYVDLDELQAEAENLI